MGKHENRLYGKGPHKNSKKFMSLRVEKGGNTISQVFKGAFQICRVNALTEHNKERKVMFHFMRPCCSLTH